VTNVRKKVALLLGLTAVFALLRLLLRRRSRVSGTPASDPREALRVKLADTRRVDEAPGDAPVPGAAAADRPAAAATEPGATDAPAEPEVEAARERVYEEGRAALDEMRRSGGL
jgi:hypothetical protein